jgi:hypothetical protein
VTPLFMLDGTVEHDPAIDAWLRAHDDDLGAIAKRWWTVMRECGPDVREVIHDGCPTVCVDGAAFAYVCAFKGHVNVGFFRGTELPDPARLLEGTGKVMRHVKVGPDRDVDAAALRALIVAAYADIRRRVDGTAQTQSRI